MSVSARKSPVLLLDDDADHAGQIQAILTDEPINGFSVEWVRQADEAIQHLKKCDYCIILLNFNFLNSAQVYDLQLITEHSNNAYVVVMIANNIDRMGERAIALGANDYLDKDQLNPYWLRRSFNHILKSLVSRQSTIQSEARFRAVIDASPLGIVISDTQSNSIYSNAAYLKISGKHVEKCLGVKWSESIHPDDHKRVLSEWRKTTFENTVFTSEFRYSREDGTVVWTRVNIAPIGTNARPKGYVQMIEDISERKSNETRQILAEEASFKVYEQSRLTLDSIGYAIVTIDLEGRVTYLNLVAETMTGWSCNEAVGRPISEVINIVNHKRASPVSGSGFQVVSDRVVTDKVCSEQFTGSTLVRRDGSQTSIDDTTSPILDRNGTVTGTVIAFHDLSQSQAMVVKMTYQAQHDFLTGLPNRLLLEDRLNQAIVHADRQQKLISILFLDLDYFKNINDCLGHSVGDKLLQSVADRLRNCVRAADTVARRGGDEFVVLLADIEHPLQASQIAEKVLMSLSAPFKIDKNDLNITPSIGISVYPADGENSRTLLHNADTAMYHAKESGRNKFQFFRPEMNIQAMQQMQTKVRLRRALKNEEFVLHYQPEIELESGEIIGIEALIRWQDPKLGLLKPKDFISIAEGCGLIVPIGLWVLREVCQQIQRWQKMGFEISPVSVNISAIEFRHKGFVDDLLLILEETQVDPRYLEMEITESVLMHEFNSSSKRLDSLKAMGIKIAIDNFGSGYSSFRSLQRFPIDRLKIDQSFVRGLSAGTEDAILLTAMIGMGKCLNQHVIVAGIETLDQLKYLQTHQCEGGQGFLFSKPIPCADMTQLLETRGCQAH